MFDKFKDECGVFGIFGHPEAANMTYLGLYALQHRGQESAGIAAADRRAGARVTGDGLRGRRVRQRRPWRTCPGTLAIGHVRYSTAGESRSANAQPILIDCAHGQIAICHNGNLVNADELRDELVRQGSIFQSSSDTEVVLHLYARSKRGSGRGGDRRVGLPGSGRVFVPDADQGSARSRCATRTASARSRSDASATPGSSVPKRARWISIGATYVRDVEPGEVLVISAQGVRSIKPFPPAPLAHCVFEHVYFARPDSYVFGKSVNEVRTNLGRILAREQRVDADVVVPVPDSGVCAAMGFADEAGIPAADGTHPQSLRRPARSSSRSLRSGTSA